MQNKSFLLILCMVLLIGGVFATQQSLADPVKVGDTATLIQTCDSCTYINLTSIQLPNSTIILNGEHAMVKTGNVYTYSFNNTDLVGSYSYITCGDLDGARTCQSVTFEVTQTGFSLNTSGGIMGIGLVAILILFFVFALVGVFKIEDYKGRFALYWVCHLLIIAISFIAWNMALENYMNNAIAGIFKIIFWVTITSAFPMVLLSLAWIFYIHTMNDHMEKLIDNGGNVEDAFSMAKKKSKRKKRW